MQHDTEAAERLPCRGCTRDCPNLHSCEHKPWRHAPDAYAPDEEQSDVESP